VALNVYEAQFRINAGVVGTDAIDRFNNKLATTGKTADAVNRNMASLAGSMRVLAGAFGIQQLVDLGMEFARVTIQIDAFQKQLSIGFGAMNTMELEHLRDTMRELGISQDEALGSAVRFTSALRLSGQTMSEANENFEAASKLILSNKLSAEGAQRVYYAMAQIASKGKLMSEELNGQLGDVLAGFTQQVADAMGVSTADMLKSMQDGEVGARQFFDALQNISGGIDEASLDSAARSLGDVKNAMFDLKGEFFASNEIKAALDSLASGINWVRENMGLLVGAAKAAAVVFGVSFLLSLRSTTGLLAILGRELVAMGAYFTAFGARATLAAAASINFSRAITGLTAASSRLFAFLGGGLGIALMAIVGGFMAASQSASNAEQRLLANADAAEALGIQLSQASKNALDAAREQRGLGGAASQAEPAIWSYKNSVDNLTESLYEQAKAARSARVEFLRQQIAAADARITEASGETWTGSRELSRRSNEALSTGDISRSFSLGFQSISSDFGNLFSGFRQDREATRDLADATSLRNAASTQLREALTTPLGRGDVPAGSSIAPAAANDNERAARAARAGAEGPTQVQIARTYENMRDSIEQDRLRALADLSQSATDRAQYERSSLSSDIQQRFADVAAASHLSDTQKQELNARVVLLQQAQLQVISAREIAENNRDAALLTQDEAQARINQLNFQQEMATSLDSRKQIAHQILTAEIALERLKQQEIIDNQTISEAERQRARIALERLIVEEAQGRQRVERDNRSGLERYGEEVRIQLDDMNASMDNVLLNGIKGLEDGLSSVLMGTKSVAAGFRDMAISIIGDLMQIAIRAAIIKPLMTALGLPGFANGGGFMNGMQFFANGGVVGSPTMFGMAGGRVGVMGEAGPEAIMPLKRTADGRLGVAASGGAGGVQNVTVNVNVEGGTAQTNGDSGKASELGKAIANAVRTELVQQKRPGGLLAA
jgi:lambda family phage tail tape measure protein